jgi:putative nucleotidyltransferase with HDIG domain
MVKAIQDPVWGYLEISDDILKIIDTEEFQRLHWIKQLGMCYLVYPGAVHTRFQHSIGTMHLAGLMANKLNSKYKREVTAAALLHDVGHFPLSHSFEEFFLSKFGKNHEEQGMEIIRGKIGTGQLSETIEKQGIDINVVLEILKGEGNEFSLENKIVSGSLDADELDYLVRDSYFTGAGNLSFDVKRIIDILRTDGSTIYIEEKGVTVVESVLISRLLMHKSVYFHKTTRIAQKMIERALFRSDNITEEFLLMHDDIFFNTLQRDFNCKGIMDRIGRRDLYKVIAKDEAGDIQDREMEDRLRDISPELIVDYIPPYSYRERRKSKSELIVKQGSRLKEISSISPLLNSLYDGFNKRYIYVYGPEKDPNIISSVERFLKQ